MQRPQQTLSCNQSKTISTTADTMSGQRTAQLIQLCPQAGQHCSKRV